MNRACENCRFCIYAHSMRGKEEPYCERRSKFIGDTLLCSEWEAVIVSKPQTNADRIRAMTDEELKDWYCKGHPNTCANCPFDGLECTMLDWLRQEVTTNSTT